MPNDPPPRRTASLRFGRPDLDLQHQQILALLGAFDALAQQPEVTEALHEAYHQLMDYVFHHFAQEELFLAQQRYPALADHQAAHRDILLALTEMADELMQPGQDARRLVQRIQALAEAHLDGPDLDCERYLHSLPPAH